MQNTHKATRETSSKIANSQLRIIIDYLYEFRLTKSRSPDVRNAHLLCTSMFSTHSRLPVYCSTEIRYIFADPELGKYTRISMVVAESLMRLIKVRRPSSKSDTEYLITMTWFQCQCLHAGALGESRATARLLFGLISAANLELPQKKITVENESFHTEDL